MGPDAAWADNLLWLVLAFAFFYSLFCWAGISLFSFDEATWARVDHLWLALVALALVAQHNSTALGAATSLLLVAALALRAARASAEILLKSRQRKALWLIVDGYLEIPVESLLEMKLQRVRTRLTQLLKDWRIAHLPLAHVRLQSACTRDAPASALLRVRPGFRECEFSFDVQQALATSELGRWMARQPVETLYLFGVVEPLLAERLIHWGRTRKVEVIIDAGHSLMVDERLPHPVAERVSR